MRRVRWTKAARADLHQIHAYIARDSKIYAQRFVDRIKAAVEDIQIFPEAGARVLEWDRDDIREIFVGDYRVIYRLRDGVEIIAAIHGARQLRG
jgi:plasmid stabilization system protein ParE